MGLVRHPRTGETRRVEGAELNELYFRGWHLVGPQSLRVPDENGVPVLRHYEDPAKAAAALDAGDGFVRGTTPQEGGALIEAERQRAHQDVLEDFGGTAAVTAATDLLSLGLSGVAQESIAPGSRETVQDIQAANPLATAGGTIAGALAPMLIPGGQGRAATGLGRAAGALRLAGPGGVSNVAGQAARRWVTNQLLNRVGLSSTASNIGGRAADVLVQEGILTGGLAGSEALANNRPLVAESILADGSVSVGLGLGFEAMLGAGGAAFRRVRGALSRTPGRRVLGDTHLQALDDVESARADLTGLRERLQRGEQVTEEDIRRIVLRPSTQEEFVAGRMGAFNELAQHFTGGKREALNVLSSPEGQRLLVRAEDELDSMAVRLAEDLRSFDEQVGSVLLDSKVETWVDSLRPELDAQPRVPALLRVKDEAENARAQLRQAAMDRTGAVVDKTSDGLRILKRGQFSEEGVRVLQLLDEELDALDDVVRVGGDVSVRDAFIAAQRTKINVDQMVKKLKLYGTAPELNNFEKDILKGITKQVQDIVKNPTIWGSRVAEAATVRGEVFQKYIDSRDGISGIVDTFTPEGRAVGKVPMASKLETALKKIGKGEVHEDIMRSLNNHMVQTTSDLLQLRRVLGESTEPLNNALATATRFSESLNEGSRMAHVLRLRNELVQREIRIAGAGAVFGLSGMGLGGGLGATIGTLLGGPVGTIVGGGAGIAAGALFTHVSRPGSSFTKIAYMRQSLERVRGRMDTGKQTLRKNLKQGRLFRIPKIDASPRRAVPAVFFASEKREDLERDYQTIRDELISMQQYPTSALDRVAASTAALEEIDPEIASELAMALGNSAAYLTKHLPPQAQDPLFPDRPATMPSRGEMAGFIRRYKALEDPLSILDDFAVGQLTLEAAEAVREVYPSLYGQIVSEIVDVIAERKPEELPYQFRVHMGTLLGIDSDLTLQPDFVAAMQNQGAQTPQQDQAIRGPDPSSRKPDIASHTLSVSQGLETQQI